MKRLITMNYKIAICDDAVADQNYMMNLMQQWVVEKARTVQIDVFSSAEDFRISEF